MRVEGCDQGEGGSIPRVRDEISDLRKSFLLLEGGLQRQNKGVLSWTIHYESFG